MAIYHKFPHIFGDYNKKYHVMKNFVLAALIFLSTYGFCRQRLSIYPTGEYKTYDLSGTDGADGRDGKDAYALDCSDGVKRAGRYGENGANGEEGSSGGDAYIFFYDYADLKKITLLQKGGRGGNPGKGGFGTAGCLGGLPGYKGMIGHSGADGDYGDIFLIYANQQYMKSDTTRVISLLEFSQEEIILTRPKWSTHLGSRNLFNKKSDINSFYRKYEGTQRFKVVLKWSAKQSVEQMGNTKIAFSMKGQQLHASAYSGSIIDYRIWQEGQVYYFEVLDANSIDEFKNLEFGKMRGSGEDMLLEVTEKFRPRVGLKTRFVVSLYEVTGKEEHFVDQFNLDKKQVVKKNDTYYLKLGRLNFPAQFKRAGVKLKVHLSVYRSAREQTRVFGLKGLFKI